MTSRGYPNLLMISLIQSSWAINFVHILGEQAQHAAYIIDQCLKRGVETIEPTEQAQAQWWGTILGSLQKGHLFGGAECTPGYFNNEGDPNKKRFIFGEPWGLGFYDFEDMLEQWRNAGDLSGEAEWGDWDCWRGCCCCW